MVPLRNLSLLLDFDDQYRRDQMQDDDFLHRRDRHLAVERGIDGGRATLGVWLDAVRGQRDIDPSPDDARMRVWGWLRTAFVVAGAIFGAAAMLGLLYYDGGRRISVTVIMAVALLQLLLALLTTAEAWIGWQPWHGLFRDVLARWLPQAKGDASIWRALATPLAARVAQSGGLAFGIAALLMLLGQVVFHDLVFGWSTTLRASAPAYHELTSALAWPWHSWLPGAVPSLQLVEQSRYFHAGTPAVSDPAMLGIWWRFLAMLWLCYVVVPRIVLLVLARLQLALRVRRLLTAHPGRAPLRERCRTPWIDSGEGAGSGTLPRNAAGRAAPLPATPGRVLIRWADAGHVALAGQWLDAGGSLTLDEDQAALEQVRAMGGPIVIVVRGWEPPTGELADFLGRVCALSGHAAVQLVPLAASNPPALVDAAALAPWHRFVERQRQPNLVIADLPHAEVRP